MRSGGGAKRLDELFAKGHSNSWRVFLGKAPGPARPMNDDHGRSIRTERRQREVARFRRRACDLLRDAPYMPLAEDRARLVRYAKFLEEEAVNLIASERRGSQVGDAKEGGPASVLTRFEIP